MRAQFPELDEDVRGQAGEVRLELLDALARRLDLLLHEERALGLELALLGLRANREVAPERSPKLICALRKTA